MTQTNTLTVDTGAGTQGLILPAGPAPSGISKLAQTLDTLVPGQRAIVSHIDTPHSTLKNRLLALGLVGNTPLYVKNLAPLGDPMSIQVRGFCLSMRKDEAHAIKVFLED